MVVQYPYKLQIFIPGPDRDENGHYIEPTSAWQDYCLCRDEAGNGKEIRGVDGVSYSFSALIQMPKGTPAIEAGKTVRVMDGDQERISGNVIRSRKDQFHSRAWV